MNLSSRRSRKTAYEQAIDSVIKGCYEYALKREAIAISYSTFSALKPVSLVFHDGMDLLKGVQLGIRTGDVAEIACFDDFMKAYYAQFSAIIGDALGWLDLTEPYIHAVNPTTLFSVTIPRCVEQLRCANDRGIRNISNVWLNGLGSAVDALMAVKELAFDTRTVTLAQLRAAQREPEKYQNLQVRVCGWNTRWNDMSRKEQEAYILRAENIQGA